MTTPTPTPCSIPPCDTDGSGEPCDRHETEAAHAEGEHEFCDVTCEARFPSEQLRNFIVVKGYPGTAGMLAELERRASTPTPDDAGLRQRIDAALSNAGAYCGDCYDFEPGGTGCPDCVRVRALYVDAVLPLVDAERAAARKEGRAAGLREGADTVACIAAPGNYTGPSRIAFHNGLQYAANALDTLRAGARAGAVHQDGQP